MTKHLQETYVEDIQWIQDGLTLSNVTASSFNHLVVSLEFIVIQFGTAVRNRPKSSRLRTRSKYEEYKEYDYSVYGNCWFRPAHPLLTDAMWPVWILQLALDSRNGFVVAIYHPYRPASRLLRCFRPVNPKRQFELAHAYAFYDDDTVAWTPCDFFRGLRFKFVVEHRKNISKQETAQSSRRSGPVDAGIPLTHPIVILAEDSPVEAIHEWETGSHARV